MIPITTGLLLAVALGNVAQSSGLSTTDPIQAFNHQRRHRAPAYVAYGPVNGATQATGSGSDGWAALVSTLTDTQPAIITYVIDFDDRRVPAMLTWGMVFVQWIPNNAPADKRRTYSSVASNLYSQVQYRIDLKLQANTKSQLDYATVLAAVKRAKGL